MKSQIQSLNEKLDNLTDAHQILDSLYQTSLKEKNESKDELNTCDNENENLRSRIRQLEMEKTQANSLQLELFRGLSSIGL